MRANLKDKPDLTFLDGFIFAVMGSIARAPEVSGFDNYYNHRLESRIGGIHEYEAELIDFIEKGLPNRRVVHAGNGIGTLACAFAARGGEIVGVEYDQARVRSAETLRAAMIAGFPEIRPRYQVVGGTFPEAGAAHAGKDAILLFTNAHASWPDELMERIVLSMQDYGDVLLDLRMFGKEKRETEQARIELFDRIAQTARAAQRRPDVSRSFHLAHFSF